MSATEDYTLKALEAIKLMDTDKWVPIYDPNMHKALVYSILALANAPTNRSFFNEEERGIRDKYGSEPKP